MCVCVCACQIHPQLQTYTNTHTHTHTVTVVDYLRAPQTTLNANLRQASIRTLHRALPFPSISPSTSPLYPHSFFFLCSCSKQPHCAPRFLNTQNGRTLAPLPQFMLLLLLLMTIAVIAEQMREQASASDRERERDRESVMVRGRGRERQQSLARIEVLVVMLLIGLAFSKAPSNSPLTQSKRDRER